MLKGALVKGNEDSTKNDIENKATWHLVRYVNNESK